MGGRLVFMLEDPSMKLLLEGLLPRLMTGWVAGQHFLCVAHQGKSDLDASIPRKLRAWQYPGDRFVVVRDNDAADCVAVLHKINGMCAEAGRPDTLVRLACQELEAWYLGDLEAVAGAFAHPKANTSALRTKFSDPDGWQKPSVEMARLIPSFQKGSGARVMAQHLRGPEHNRSHSYRKFVEGVCRVAEMAPWGAR